MPSTPDNGAYMIAAYVITLVVCLGYTVALWRRAKRALDRKEGG